MTPPHRLPLSAVAALLPWFALLSACAAPPESIASEFTIRVFAPDGSPVADPHFTQHPPRGWDVVSECESTELEPGIFRIETGSHANSGFPVSVWVPEFGTLSVPLPANEGEEVVARFSEPAWIDLFATGFHGDPGQYWVRVGATGSDAADGSYEGSLHEGNDLGEWPFQPGEYDIEIGRFTVGWEPMFADRVTIESGVNLVVAPLPITWDLTILLPQGAAGDWLTAISAAGAPLEAEEKTDDRYTYVGVPAGTYILVLEQGGAEDAMALEVPAEPVVRFRATRIDAIRIRIWFEEGLWAAAGFENGDLITAIDGRGFTRWREALAWIRIAAESEVVRITIRQGDRETTIPIAGATLLGALNAGNLLPAVR